MTIPELTKSSRYESVAAVSTGIRVFLATPASSALALLIVLLFLGSRIIYLHARLWLQRSQRFVAAYNNLVPDLQTLGDFDVSNAGNSCFHWSEECFLAVYDENSLDLVLLGITGSSWRRRC